MYDSFVIYNEHLGLNVLGYYLKSERIEMLLNVFKIRFKVGVRFEGYSQPQ